MSKMIEKALFVHDEREIEPDVNRLYFGVEFCERRIPSLSKVQHWLAVAGAHGLPCTLVTPFVTEKGLEKLVRLFRHLDRHGQHEVVFNDWGVLRVLNKDFRNLIPVAGRLLSKQRRDPRLASILKPHQQITASVSADGKTRNMVFPKVAPREVMEYYRSSVVNVPIFQQFLVSRGINRVELDVQMWDMDIRIPADMGGSLYVPFSYVTCTRMCGKVTLSYASCGKECQKYILALQAQASPVPLYSCGNTVFYRAPVPAAKKMRAWGIDRVVFQPRFPL